MTLLDLYIENDTDFAQKIVMYSDCQKQVPIDLSDYALRAQIKNSAGTAVGEFVIIETNAAIGEISLTLSAAETLAIAAGSYSWDLRMEDGDGQVLRWIGGTVTVATTVTREA